MSGQLSPARFLAISPAGQVAGKQDGIAAKLSPHDLTYSNMSLGAGQGRETMEFTDPLNRRSALRLASGLIGLGLATSISNAEPVAPDLFGPRDDLDELYDKRVDQAIRRGLQLLAARQNADGSFQTNEQGRWVGVVALAGLAFLSRGVRSGVGEAGQVLRRAGEYVLSQVQSSGFLSAKGETSHGPMYDHGFGTLFLAELFGTDQALDIRPKLSQAVKLIIRTQNDRGGWRYNPKVEEADLSVTVCQMMALRAARNAGFGVPKETIDRAVDYVRRSQNRDGGYVYQITGGGESRFPLTAAAIVALYNAGIYQGPEIEEAIEFLNANKAANSTQDRNGFYFYAHYYSAQAFWHQGGEAWSDWYKMLKRNLLSLQNTQGGWFDYNSVEYGTAMSCLILNMPRTVLPIFQR